MFVPLGVAGRMYFAVAACSGAVSWRTVSRITAGFLERWARAEFIGSLAYLVVLLSVLVLDHGAIRLRTMTTANTARIWFSDLEPPHAMCSAVGGSTVCTSSSPAGRQASGLRPRGHARRRPARPRRRALAGKGTGGARRGRQRGDRLSMRVRRGMLPALRPMRLGLVLRPVGTRREIPLSPVRQRAEQLACDERLREVLTESDGARVHTPLDDRSGSTTT